MKQRNDPIPRIVHNNGLARPALSVSHDTLDALSARAGGGLEVTPEAALPRAALPLSRPSADTEEGSSITSIDDANGNPRVPLLTSYPNRDAYLGVGARRVRVTLENFPDGFGGLPIVLSPGCGIELALDPAAIRQQGAP